MYSCPPPPLFHDCILQWGFSDSPDRFSYSLDEMRPEFRAYVSVGRHCLREIRLGFGQPENGIGHRVLTRPALTCSQGMTAEGSC